MARTGLGSHEPSQSETSSSAQIIGTRSSTQTSITIVTGLKKRSGNISGFSVLTKSFSDAGMLDLCRKWQLISETLTLRMTMWCMPFLLMVETGPPFHLHTSPIRRLLHSKTGNQNEQERKQKQTEKSPKQNNLLMSPLGKTSMKGKEPDHPMKTTNMRTEVRIRTIQMITRPHRTMAFATLAQLRRSSTPRQPQIPRNLMAFFLRPRLGKPSHQSQVL